MTVDTVSYIVLTFIGVLVMALIITGVATLRREIDEQARLENDELEERMNNIGGRHV